MLKKFTLRNYKNFKNEISIDFENIAGYQFNMDCLYEGTIGKMLIYGRNATGKTNLGNALLDIVATMFGRRRYTRNEVFLNADSTENVHLVMSLSLMVQMCHISIRECRMRNCRMKHYL